MLLPLTFTPVDLVWIAAEWAAAETDDGKEAQRDLVLSYKPPESVTQIADISLSVEAESVRKLLDGYGDDKGGRTKVVQSADCLYLPPPGYGRRTIRRSVTACWWSGWNSTL